MKYARILRLLGIAVIMTLLLATIPAAPVLSYDRLITVTIVEDGDDIEITVEGEDWRASTDSTERHVDIYMSSQEAEIGDTVGSDITRYKLMRSPMVGEEDTDDEGTFTSTFNAPDELNDGSSDREMKKPTSSALTGRPRNASTV